MVTDLRSSRFHLVIESGKKLEHRVRGWRKFRHTGKQIAAQRANQIGLAARKLRQGFDAPDHPVVNLPAQPPPADRWVLRGIDLEIAAGEFIVIVGRSGCGKTTLLRLFAGLDRLSVGRIQLDGYASFTESVRLMFQVAAIEGDILELPLSRE